MNDLIIGDFYWPQTDLELTEKPTSSVQSILYKVSEIGQSCDSSCQQEGYTCTNDLLSLNPEDFAEAILGKALCEYPLVSGCGVKAATYDPSTQFCYYPESNCNDTGRPAPVYSCATSIEGSARFCACNTQENSVELSASTSLRSGSFLAFIALFFINPKAAVIALALIAMSAAHNWVNTPSRSVGASTYQPFKPPVTDMPHVAIGPGQSFQIEWATGHTGYTFVFPCV